MSEADVNQIRDEDVLRRMWQQTEDFGRKKEIRAHMYRLREERLRNLYSPEPTTGKGCEFSSGQEHVHSFADQTFQSMKSKEVRDAGSPPKEFNYSGQDLKELSNAGWNVESEDKTTDDGRTHVKSVNANIEGRYDVEGGRGQFAAVDRQRQAVTEFQDDNTKMRRDESSSDTAAHEHVVRKMDDGTRFSSTTSSSNTSSKIQQVSSTVHEAPAIHDYDLETHDTNRNEKVTRIINTEQNLRSNDFQNGELISRKIDYPDDNTKVIVETRCLPDGTRVTSTKREFRAPAQSTRSEYQTRSESRSHSSQQTSDTKKSSSKTIKNTSDDYNRDTKIFRQPTDNRRNDDIVDSQRFVDDNDFKRQLREYTVSDDTNSEIHCTNQSQSSTTSNITDHFKTKDSKTHHETRVTNKVIDSSTNITDDCTQVLQTNQRYVDNIDQNDHRKTIETLNDRNLSHKETKETRRVTDDNKYYVTDEPRRTGRESNEPMRNVPREHDEPNWNILRNTNEPSRYSPRESDEPNQNVHIERKKQVHNTSNITDERTHKITSDTKVEVNVERKKSNDYQTTYQNDFHQKKVSNDWSPTQQAWASTLRADTPSTTRPSTRASSPGSKTFKSSTSSLRSSVSPDKSFRKPSSRGGSPNKVDRYSPTRSVTSDRHSNTFSTHSVTEVKTTKQMSPERKTFSNRSPAGYSPERKLRDNNRPRPSVSPEKRPSTSIRPSESPERKPTQNTSDGFPTNTSPTRAAGLPSVPRQSPERRPYQPSDLKIVPDTVISSPVSPQRSNTSPERKPTADNIKTTFPRSSPSPDRKPDASPDKAAINRQSTPSCEPENLVKRPSASPERKPGYMRPTAASQPSPNTKSSKPGDEPSNILSSETSQTSTNYSKTVTQVKQDHYKFIDEETKMNTDKTYSLPSNEDTVPKNKSPSKHSPDFTESSLQNEGRAPSPQKKTVIISKNDELHELIDKSKDLVDIITTQDKLVTDVHVVKQTLTDTIGGKNMPRDASPTKIVTYDKKKPRDVTDTTETKNSLKRLDKNSPKKIIEHTSPTKKSPRNSVSPVKSPTRETKIKQATDFIITERNTEEINKKTTKERPRQLQTPSSSPTRMPQVETEPSTGQSSPTTSVSGFIYFGSPQTERPVVTDLDEGFEPAGVYPNAPEFTRPENLDLKRSTSPSKIPCRSPSPQKSESPTMEGVPRKSSLKKPSNLTSPIDKPPSSFNVSPTEDKPDHKIVKKNLNGEQEPSLPMKVKPPLTRRETYEDRCRLNLGMADSITTETVKKEINNEQKPESNKSSPSVSPCGSPVSSTLFSDLTTQEKIMNVKTDVTDFIAKEQEAILITTNTFDKMSKIPSQDNSPSKLQDTISKTTILSQIDSITQKNENNVTALTDIKHTRKLPENITKRPSESPERQVSSKQTNENFTPKVLHTETCPRGISPTRPRLSVSPERKLIAPVRVSPEKQLSDKRPSHDQLDETNLYSKTIKIDDVNFDATSTTENYKTTSRTIKERSPRTRVLESPTRQLPTATLEHPSSESSSRPSPIVEMPKTEIKSPSHKMKSQVLEDKPEYQYYEKKSPSERRESPKKATDLIITSTHISSSYDTSLRTKETEETIKSVTDNKNTKTTSISPTRKTLENVPRSVSPTKRTQPSTTSSKNERSPERRSIKDIPVTSSSPRDSSSSDIPGYMRSTAASITSKNDITITENVSESITSKIVDRKHSASKPSGSQTRNISVPRTPSPTKTTRQPSASSSPERTQKKKPQDKHPEDFSLTCKTVEYEKNTTDNMSQLITSTSEDVTYSITSKDQIKCVSEKPKHLSIAKDTNVLQDKPSKRSTPNRPSISPERKPNHMKPTSSITSKHESIEITNDKHETTTMNAVEHKQPSLKCQAKSEEPRYLRTPSPTKKTVKVTEVSTDFLMSEREQEILDRVQKSLRKLSPERKEKSPSKDKNPSKNTTSLTDLDIKTESFNTHEFETENVDILEEHVINKTNSTRQEKSKDTKPKDHKITSKPSSRNVSPIKKAPSVPTSSQIAKSPEMLTKSRSISPRKPLSQTDRPQSPHGSRTSGIKSKDHAPFNRKPTPATLSTYKIENDIKKTNVVTKQNVSKTASHLISPQAIKPNEPEPRRIPTPKGIKDNMTPKKETVNRTSSDSNIKPKKTSPQRIKSKPEIQVNDLSTKSPKYQKPIIKEPHSRLPAKPKSATALNTSIDEDDDIIIDVQQSKSSRENSPDRICPTPVNFADDVGTPRFPDEVSEPDDEYRKRSYHTIHETESVVDDIVEICEDEELFVKKTDVTSETEDMHFNVNDKVNKFTNRMDPSTKPKNITSTFKDTEMRVHSDFVDESIKSDECLLSVSEKVNKFAKGPRDAKDNRSPSRKITDEYDKNTIYQDDYTKLSVNDKAHLFVETAENIKVPKIKLGQKVDRPDLSNVDESLKKDDCLLSVSDKVNKFVKTAENIFTDTQESDQKGRNNKEQHNHTMKQIVNENDNGDVYEIDECTKTTITKNVLDNGGDSKKPYKKDATLKPNKDYDISKSKPSERTPTVKITTLRSSEAVKKAKAMFENIASTQKTKDVTHTTTKTTKLTDIGVIQNSPKTDSIIVLHPSVETDSLYTSKTESEMNVTTYVGRTTERQTTGTLTRPRHSQIEEKPRVSPSRLTAKSPEVPRTKSPMRQCVETTPNKGVSPKYPSARAESPRQRAESPRHRPEQEKPDKIPGYLRPTKTSQIKEETKLAEESEMSSRRGSGKFGVDLRKTSIERSTVSSERRRSVEHHQPCIEDIFDLDLLEQMLEKVVGYEQRRRIRSQIRVVKNESEHKETHTHTQTKNTTNAPKSKASEQHPVDSPDNVPKHTYHRTLSPDRQNKTPQRMQHERSNPKESSAVLNGHVKEPVKKTLTLRPNSPEKLAPKSIHSAKNPIRQPSPTKKRTVSPTKTTHKSKSNRFNEYASAYMKKVGLNEAEKVKFADKKTQKLTEGKKTVSYETQDRTSQEFTTTKSFTASSERTSSRDIIEIVQVNGKRSPSPEKITGILRKPQSPERRVYSPVGKALSPERNVYSPDCKAPESKIFSSVKKNQVPERNAHSPESRGYSPVSKVHERKFHSPERKIYSPVGKTEPEREAHSPERRPHSPAHKVLERQRQSPDRIVQIPERKPQSPDRNGISPADRLYQRSPSPEFKRHKSDTRKETIIKTVYDIEKKIPTKPIQEEKPSWVTNRNLKKITSETRTFSSKKLETEKPKYRASSPSKVISKPIDVITSSYGPGPLDADGRPLFGIKALRNGATNFQVKGTVVRQEFHSRNGAEPEGTVSVTAYSSQPEELEQLMAAQGLEPPSRIHGLSAITTTKKFGGDTGISMTNVNTKEERASLDHFTQTERRMESHVDNSETCNFDTREQIIGDSKRIDYNKTNQTVKSDKNDRTRDERVTEVRKEERKEKIERREDKKTVRQSSVKSLTEKFYKSANDSGKTDRSTYPKAGLILRTSSTVRDSVSSDEALPGLARTDSENSIGSVDDVVVTTSTDRAGAVTTTTRTSRHHGPTTTHLRTSTVTHHEPIITTRKTTTTISSSQEPVVTRVVTQGPVKTGQRQGTERSFLDSNTKVTGVQDILTRMKNADIVAEAGDSAEDGEARALLNKFLGATVLMAGMQGYVVDQPPAKLTLNQETVRTSSGKVSTTRVEDIDLDQCWDERLLRQLLDECTDYEQRRRLRARIRSLMAEQEACAAAVTDALGAAHIAEAETGVGEPRGESLLLPLLQGLLGGGGERLLAGLGAAPADVVADVRRSLARLRAALAEPAAHPQARALLALADRLEDALDAADRLDGCRRRPRRRSRAARHTVGVTREELDQARRRVDADPLGLAVADRHASSSAGSTGTSDGVPTPERKASVDVDGELDFHAAVEAKPKPPPPQHSVSSEAPRKDHEARPAPATVPVERRAAAPRRPDFFRHSMADATPQQPIPRMDRRPSETKSSIAAIANKFDASAQMERQQPAAVPRRAPVVAPKAPVKEERTFFRPLPPTYNFAAPPPAEEESKPIGRFNATANRKLRMKRANTIDIGRPLAGYRLDGDDPDEEGQHLPLVPDFRPQTDNDRKFVAFMKKNEAAERDAAVNGGGPANWSSRFGNIKNAFESREREDHSRSSSASSSARRFWRAADEPASGALPGMPRARRLFTESTPEIVKPPWVTERREPARNPLPQAPRHAQPPRAVAPPMPLPASAPMRDHPQPLYRAPAPPYPKHPPATVPMMAPPIPKSVTTGPPLPKLIPIPPAPASTTLPSASSSFNSAPSTPQSPSRPVVPFVARPIPVNQFSHAPLSAFKPPAKISSPVNAPPLVWSPPSFGAASPSTERAPPFSPSPHAFAPSPPSAAWPAPEPAWTLSPIATKPYTNGFTPTQPRPIAYDPPSPLPTSPPSTHPPTHVLSQNHDYTTKAIPNQRDLSAPELVRRMNGESTDPSLELDAQRLQIEFYERQIREQRRRAARDPPPPPPPSKERAAKQPPPYTITDFTAHDGVSTFVPLQRTPDIEKARAHKVDYLPDVVTNETDRPRTPFAPTPAPARAPPVTELPAAVQNGDAPHDEEGDATEHKMAVSRVMRGPVRGAATLTAGVRTRGDPAPAEALRGALGQHAERRKRSQVPLPPPAACAPPARPSPPSLGASRESVASSGSAPSAGALSRSGSCHQLSPASGKSASLSTSPRRIVARTKSMHLLAVPKLFEGGIAREEISEKRRSVEAYFSSGGAPPSLAAPPVSGRRSPGRGRFALGRSRTMGALSELQFLDESNADDAFEDLVSALA